MQHYFKRFEIRWSDLDANRHVANASYVAFMSHVRMSFLQEHGITLERMMQLNIGPVVLKEEFHYLKEVLPGETVTIDLRALGISPDYRFAKWEHALFRETGELAVYSTITFCWIDLLTRKLIKTPEELRKVMELVPQAPEFRTLRNDELRDAHVPRQRKLDFLTGNTG